MFKGIGESTWIQNWWHVMMLLWKALIFLIHEVERFGAATIHHRLFLETIHNMNWSNVTVHFSSLMYRVMLRWFFFLPQGPTITWQDTDWIQLLQALWKSASSSLFQYFAAGTIEDEQQVCLKLFWTDWAVEAVP